MSNPPGVLKVAPPVNSGSDGVGVVDVYWRRQLAYSFLKGSAKTCRATWRGRCDRSGCCRDDRG